MDFIAIDGDLEIKKAHKRKIAYSKVHSAFDGDSKDYSGLLFLFQIES